MKAQWSKGFKDIVQRAFVMIDGGRQLGRKGSKDRKGLTNKKTNKQTNQRGSQSLKVSIFF